MISYEVETSGGGIRASIKIHDDDYLFDGSFPFFVSIK